MKIDTSLQQGMTLIELMIVVAIVGILASVAYPSYQDHIIKSRRADAQANLYELAQFMERFYTTNGTYLNGANPPTLPFGEAPKDGGTKYYDLTVAATATTYTLTATRKGAQISDTRCGNLTLTNTGLKGVASATQSATQCWSR